MTLDPTLTATELAPWLARVTQTIDRSLRDPHRTALTSSLRPDASTKVGLGMLAPVALLADCLHVAQIAIQADGKIEDVELARVRDLVHVAAGKYFQLIPAYEAFEEGIGDLDDVRRFLRLHHGDAGPFGFATSSPWRGLSLVRAVEEHTHNAGPKREHETLLARIMETVFAGRGSEIERDARRRLRKLFEPAPRASDIDPRAVAFCREDGPEVFSAIAHGSQIHERDHFDVEAIHAEARDAFHREIVRATTPSQLAGHGRMLLVLGDSGAGKTHLMRALRTQLHAQGLGYAGYLQMTTEITDYARYVLRNLVDSLERSYDSPIKSESGLTYLSDGLVQNRVAIPAAELERLRGSELSSEELDRTVGTLVDRIVRTEGLEHLDTDLVHALLLLQRRDPALQRRIVKYLRCEHLGTHDRNLLGGLASRDQAEDPLRTLQQLGALIFEIQTAALVLLVDQIEDTIPDGMTATRMQQALDNLRAVTDAVPNAVVVVACLTDVYDAVRGKLSQPVVDRLERDAPPLRLATQREVVEIEQMLGRRLEHLFTTFDVTYRDDDPLFPFAHAQLEAVQRFRARDVLARFREFHQQCIAAGHVVPPGIGAVLPPVAPVAPVAPPELEEPSGDFERAWQSALAAEAVLPDDDAAILALVAESVRGEAPAGIEVTVRGNQLAIGGRIPARVVEVCNRAPQGGHLGKQLDGLRGRTPAGASPFALRSSDWTFAPKSAIAKQVAAFVAAGGYALVVGERDLRAMCAWRAIGMREPRDAVVRPLSQLPLVRALLDLDRAAPAAIPPELPPTAPPGKPPARAMPTIPPAPSQPVPVVTDPTQLRIGVTATLRAEPILLSLEDVKTHVAVLGTTGSGKTTAALNVIEQLLERGISVLVVDRKGDLAVYARDGWWADDPRKRALRAKLDIDLFTPGNSTGRPLRLPVIPAMADASPADRDQLAKFAAAGLATMMSYGKSGKDSHKLSILQCAIGLHAADREVSLAALHDTISQPDPELLQRVGTLQRHFTSLSEDLQSLAIQRGALLAGEGDALDVAAMLPAPTPDGRARLTIVNTAAIAEVPVLEFWMSRLLVELARLARKRPSKTLQGVAFFDECDAYIPAIGAPPTKEPMFDLLRRARSAGLGMLLATQNPGDLDYKARELIGTWLVGKVGEARAIDKMRNLLGSYPNVAGRLANQTTGQFFLLRPGKAIELRADRSMMQTEQLAESEIAALARSR